MKNRAMNLKKFQIILLEDRRRSDIRILVGWIRKAGLGNSKEAGKLRIQILFMGFVTDFRGE
jgi:hypothetical protein